MGIVCSGQDRKISRSETNKDLARTIFAEYDTNSDGRVDFEDVVNYNLRLGRDQATSEHEANKLFKTLIIVGDYITCDYFVEWVEQRLTRPPRLLDSRKEDVFCVDESSLRHELRILDDRYNKVALPYQSPLAIPPPTEAEEAVTRWKDFLWNDRVLFVLKRKLGGSLTFDHSLLVYEGLERGTGAWQSPAVNMYWMVNRAEEAESSPPGDSRPVHLLDSMFYGLQRHSSCSPSRPKLIFPLLPDRIISLQFNSAGSPRAFTRIANREGQELKYILLELVHRAFMLPLVQNIQMVSAGGVTEQIEFVRDSRERDSCWT